MLYKFYWWTSYINRKIYQSQYFYLFVNMENNEYDNKLYDLSESMVELTQNLIGDYWGMDKIDMRDKSTGRY